MNDIEKIKKIREHHYPNDRPIRPLIVELEHLNYSAPSSWEGTTVTGEPVYIRYGWGKFVIKIGAMPLDDNEPHTVIEFQCETPEFQSQISESDMKHILQMYLDFNL